MSTSLPIDNLEHKPTDDESPQIQGSGAKKEKGPHAVALDHTCPVTLDSRSYLSKAETPRSNNIRVIVGQL